MMKPQTIRKPYVAIIGKPNVGKSTLFNRIIGKRKAIVEDFPGVTRDRNYEDTSIYEKNITLVDTGGFDPIPGDPLTDLTREQVIRAIEESDVLIFILDGRAELTVSDYETMEQLRKSLKPYLVVANKVDNEKMINDAFHLYKLGIEDIIMVSANSGRGIGKLLDKIYELLPEEEKSEQDIQNNEEIDDEKKIEQDLRNKETPKIVIIGRPNVGKSSLINYLLGDERVLTSAIPGTTRDPIDCLINWKEKEYILIDTAGIRRKKKVEKKPERHAVNAAIKSMELADIVVFLIDAIEGPTQQETKLIGLAIDRGKAIIIAVNKWDLKKGKKEEEKAMIDKIDDIFSFASWIPNCFISAKTGAGITKLFKLIDTVYEEYNKRATTGKLNRLFTEILVNHPPPLSSGKAIKFYYITQAQTKPPTFVISTNFPKDIHFSYHRYLTNKLRENFGFTGTPVKVIFKE